MYVITADQIDSRHDIDRAGEAVSAILTSHGDRLALPPDQTAGDEIQIVTERADAALEIVLGLHRLGHWSIGVGVGPVRFPLADAARKSAGAAFIAARDAIGRAKRADSRFALTASGPTGPSAAQLDGASVEPLISLLLLSRARRSAPGWEAVDLANTGLSQQDIAARLSISAAAVSQRLKAALWRAEVDVTPVLAKLLEDLDRPGDDATRETREL